MPDKMISVTAPNMAIHPGIEDNKYDFQKKSSPTQAQEIWNDTRQEEQDDHHKHNHEGLHKQDLVCDAILLL